MAVALSLLVKNPFRNARVIALTAVLLVGAATLLLREPRVSFLRPGLRLNAYVSTADGSVAVVDLVRLRAVARVGAEHAGESSGGARSGGGDAVCAGFFSRSRACVHGGFRERHGSGRRLPDACHCGARADWSRSGVGARDSGWEERAGGEPERWDVGDS